MNRTKIETCDFTWNPVVGCWGPGGTAEKPKRCFYCYAQGITKRFNRHSLGDPFMPMFYPERLSEPAKVKKPSKIFVCSMADLFGDWVPSSWISAVLEVGEKNPQHIFQFLSKNPYRLKAWNGFWPPNCWVGTTVTNQGDDWRIAEVLKVDAAVRFVSHEPLLGPIEVPGLYPYQVSTYKSPGSRLLLGSKINWAIIGAMTGPGAVKPKPEEVQSLIDQYRAAGVSLFLKDNLHWLEKIQEWPR